MAFQPLPAYNGGNALNFDPLNQAVNNWGETTRRNALANYQAGQDAIQNKRQNALLGIQQQQAQRAQAQFDEQRGKEALNQMAGIYQAIDAAPEAERPAMYQRFKPFYDRLRQRIPEFDQDATALGIDPNDHTAFGKLIIAQARGYQDPLEAQKTQAEIALKNAQAGYYNERPRTVAGGATTQLIDRLMAENPGLTLEQAITIAKRGAGVTTVGNELVDRNTGAPVRNVSSALSGAEVAKGEGENIARVRAGLPEARQRLTLITGGLDRIKNTATSLAQMPGLDSVVGGLYQAYVPNVTEKSLNAETELDNLKVKISGAVLQSMRDMSKTGGAVGQVTEREWPRLENMISNLDPKQGKPQFLRNLQEVVAYVDGVKSAIQQAYDADVATANGGALPAAPTQPQAAPPPAADGWQDIGGVRVRVKPGQ